jgi:dTDP-4-dehydrorhamnose 3,5-epimerase
MEILPTRLAGLILLEPDTFPDERGFFLETFNARRHAQFGVVETFVQDNHSRSARDTIRGLHFQAPPGQAKLVSVARGRIWDVAVDVRGDSPTYGEWEAFELDDVRQWQLFVPVGFAHGFCVLSNEADVCYKVTTYYAPDLERGIAFDDPALSIPWPIERPRVSDRDRRNPPLADALA